MANSPLRPELSAANIDETDVKQRSLFARLKKLFASGVIVRNVGGKKLRVKDTSDLMYATDRNSLRDRFNRVRSTSYNAYTRDFSLAYQAARIDLFRDYDTMDMDPIIASALDIYADECLSINELGKILVVHAEDDNIKGILHNLYYDILNVEHNLWSWTRNTCKYGDFYMRLYISPEYGVYQIEPISAYNVERLENTDPLNKNYVKFQIRPTDTSQVETLEQFECTHFRLLSDSNFLPYGKCLRGDSKIWTLDGYKSIKNIKSGDVVYSFDYDTSKVVAGTVKNTIMSGIKKTYEIKTAHRKIYATFEHPFMVRNGQYKKVKELTLNDCLVLPSLTCNVGVKYPKLIVEETDNWQYDDKLIRISESLLKENFKDLIRFFGFMLGDGWLDKSNKTVCFSLGNRLDKSHKYIEYMNKLGVSYRLTNGMESDSSCVINSVYLYRLMEQLEFKTGTLNKIVPTWIWMLPVSFKQELLFGFSDADGCDIDDNTFQLGTINETLIDDLRQIAMQSGLSTTKKITVTGKGYGGKCIIHSFTYKFTSRDFKVLNETCHIEKIRSIKECEKEEVYDIQIDNNLHNFIADGVVVHNSMIEGARRVWKQLSLMEDAMLIHRIMRAPERRIFKLDVGNIPPQDVDSFMEKAISKMKKVPYIDPQTGDYNLRFNLQSMVEDFYLPVRGSDSGTSIDTLSGMEFTGIDDIEYIRNKLMAALKIPKAFLGYEEELSGKATLASEDVRFAKTIQRIQKVIVSALESVAIVHLYSQGYRDESLTNFKIELTNPSTIFEKEKIEIWSDKTELAKNMMENKIFSKGWIYKNVFNLSEDDSNELLDQIVEDSKQMWRFKSIEEEGNDPAKPFKKINPNAEAGDVGPLGGGGPEDILGGPGGEPGGGMGVGGSELPSLSPLEEDSKEEGEIVTEKHGEHADDYVRPSQAGNKNARRDYRFGEDPLGDKENNAKTRPGRALTHKWQNDSPLSLESSERKNEIGGVLKSLKTYLDKTKPEKKELIKEAEANGSKSLLDESNILP